MSSPDRKKLAKKLREIRELATTAHERHGSVPVIEFAIPVGEELPYPNDRVEIWTYPYPDPDDVLLDMNPPVPTENS